MANIFGTLVLGLDDYPSIASGELIEAEVQIACKTTVHAKLVGLFCSVFKIGDIVYFGKEKHIVKRIKVDKSMGWFNNIHFGRDDYDHWSYDSEEEGQDWRTGVEYIMKEDGKLYDLKGNPASRSRSTRIDINSNGEEIITNDNNSNDNYRYNKDEPMNKIDSMQMKVEKEKQRVKDSLEKAKQKIEQQLQKISNNTEEAPLSSQLPAHNPVVNID